MERVPASAALAVAGPCPSAGAEVIAARGSDAVALAVGTRAGLLSERGDQAVPDHPGEGRVDLAEGDGLVGSEQRVVALLEVVAVAGAVGHEAQQGGSLLHVPDYTPGVYPECL